MSGLIVGLVLRIPISDAFNTEAKFVATVYADHAWEDGTHAYPAVDTVAKITGFSARTVQRYLRVLVKIGVLIPNGYGARGTNRYDFPLSENTDDGSIKLDIRRGDPQSPRQPDKGDTVSGDTVSGDIGVTQTNNPLVVVIVDPHISEISKIYEAEFGAVTPMVTCVIKDAVDTYPPDWIPEAMQIAVKNNARNWKYVEGILKQCKAKKVRPLLSQKEPTHANKSGSTKSQSKPAVEQAGYTDADRAAAERVRNKRAGGVS